MITVKKEGILLQKTSLAFESEGVLNPAVIRVGDDVHLFYRAVAKGNFSTIGYCKLSGPATIKERWKTPIINAEFDYELHGLEDPRVVKIEDTYYLTYTAYDGVNALGALAISTNLVNWHKQGLIVPQLSYEAFNDISNAELPLHEKYLRYNAHEGLHYKDGKQLLIWDKNVIFFPRRIDGKLFFLHRIKPDIQIVVSITKLEDLTHEFWKNYFLNFDENIVLAPKYDHETSYLGGGCPPIETPHGWLLIYHGVQDTIKGYVYAGCAALLDLKNPKIELARLPYPLFKPEEIWELKGEVNNVCFPTGSAIFDDTLYIYYGAADEQIAYATVSLSALLNELLLNAKNDTTK